MYIYTYLCVPPQSRNLLRGLDIVSWGADKQAATETYLLAIKACGSRHPSRNLSRSRKLLRIS